MARHQDLHAPALLDEIARTKPIAVVMAEEISALRAWAQGRTVSAG
jgi:hypothetical protein